MPEILDYRLFFDQMPEPRIVVRASWSDFFVVECNRAAQTLFGKDASSIIGKSVFDLMDNENAQQLSHVLLTTMKTKSPLGLQSLPTFPGNTQLPNFSINPVFLDSGEIVYIDIMGQPMVVDDSALQRERDDALLLLTSIFDVSEVGIIVTDHNRRIVKMNDSFVRIYGWSRTDMTGHDFVEIVPFEERDNAKNNHEEYIRDGIRSSGEMRVQRKNGTIANVLYTTATLELSKGRRFLVTTIMDISLRKQMEYSLRVAKEQADTANRAKSAFLANMSHELRTPLNAILGFSEMMMKETFGPLGHNKYGEYMEDIHLSAKHLLEIINEVLDMSKIEAGKVELDEQDIDLRALIDSVVRIMASRAFGSGIELQQTIDENLPTLYADPRLVRQILINLMTNALKYTARDGRVDVRAHINPSTGDMQLIVQDNGIGIPKNRIQDAMEPFGQIHDPTRANTQQGTGLGLPLTKAMAKLHGGNLELDSDTGIGTTVIVTFPKNRIRAITH